MSRQKINTKTQGFSQKIFLFNKAGKFLTIRRTKTAPSDPLKWDLPGGDVEFGEDPLRSIVRELTEETNLTGKDYKLFAVEAHLPYPKVHWITLAYCAKLQGGKLDISWEHDLHKWVTVNEFLKLKISKKLRYFAKTLKKYKF